MDAEFKRVICDPLEAQAKAIGNLADYRICAVCLNYTPRASYREHMEQVHGYETIEIGHK